MGLIVVDHKQTKLQMKYREGQVEYFGKKGMSMLRLTIFQWKSRSSIHLGEENIPQGLEYIFTSYVFKGYAGQDNVHVTSAIKALVKKVK